MNNQCCNCGKDFQIAAGKLYCSSVCEERHDLFGQVKEGKAMPSTVSISYLTPEQLEEYKNTRVPKSRKPQRVADWRWPQNRRKNG
ncbi:hypothetical protein J1P26_22760 [Neobacillus sp. MM2021_6]|uniref:hypothetical protein n=1 Tax=Bacillaceae TaxID=186817 RepID=UPI00140E7741|nr:MULTISPECIES: hypothetical protein [Bacillaceae]MBO0962520.1 hypothetical protein [Neobacillus sp. MM2021_6]NHC21002.1 hypothetical protein [Bacillus sp. MM2020_4]